ncbi:MAG: LPS export ABC transporter periplasmic protein LptC [Candidatus Cloacimonetes bacterium]|nr:LPS export ABC transporter periplasmic protein LptC [Candidatus Cloacimonadota bacterium]
MIRVCRDFWLILSLSSLLLIPACSDKVEFSKIPDLDKIPDEQADSIKITSTTDNKVEYILTAVHYYKFYKAQQTFADSVFVTFYNEDGSIKSTLECNKAEVDDVKNTLTGIGDVVVISENGTMKAPLIFLDRNSSKLFAKEGVTFLRDNNILRGLEMESDLNLDRVEITKVSAEGKLKENEITW